VLRAPPRPLGSGIALARDSATIRLSDAGAHPEEIHALIEVAFNAGDLDAFLALHEDDATTVVPPDGRRATGHAAIRAAFVPMFASGPRTRSR